MTEYERLKEALEDVGGELVGVIGTLDSVRYEGWSTPHGTYVVGVDARETIGVWTFRGKDGEPAERDIDYIIRRDAAARCESVGKGQQ